MTDDAFRLAAAKRTVAVQHFGDPAAGELLRGGNLAQLRASAEQLRRASGLHHDGSRPSPEAALYLARVRERQARDRLLRRFVG